MIVLMKCLVVLKFKISWSLTQLMNSKVELAGSFAQKGSDNMLLFQPLIKYRIRLYALIACFELDY